MTVLLVYEIIAPRKHTFYECEGQLRVPPITPPVLSTTLSSTPQVFRNRLDKTQEFFRHTVEPCILPRKQNQGRGNKTQEDETFKTVQTTPTNTTNICLSKPNPIKQRKKTVQ